MLRLEACDHHKIGGTSDRTEYVILPVLRYYTARCVVTSVDTFFWTKIKENFTPLGTHFDSCKYAMNVGLNSNSELRNPIGTGAILPDFHWIRPFWTSLDLI
jgi:hypothetical protein